MPIAPLLGIGPYESLPHLFWNVNWFALVWAAITASQVHCPCHRTDFLTTYLKAYKGTAWKLGAAKRYNTMRGLISGFTFKTGSHYVVQVVLELTL